MKKNIPLEAARLRREDMQTFAQQSAAHRAAVVAELKRRILKFTAQNEEMIRRVQADS
jgi:hypothetical protein